MGSRPTDLHLLEDWKLDIELVEPDPDWLWVDRLLITAQRRKTSNDKAVLTKTFIHFNQLLQTLLNVVRSRSEVDDKAYLCIVGEGIFECQAWTTNKWPTWKSIQPL